MLSRDPTEFLAGCSEQVRQMYEYWKDKCAGRAMPQRSDIDPLDIARHLPNITLVDVVADARRYVYRVAGTREVDARGADSTGQSVLDRFSAARRAPRSSGTTGSAANAARCFATAALSRRRAAAPDARPCSCPCPPTERRSRMS